MRGAWASLQQTSRAAIILLVVILAGVAVCELADLADASLPIVSGFVAAAAVLVVYTEWDAGREG